MVDHNKHPAEISDTNDTETGHLKGNVFGCMKRTKALLLGGEHEVKAESRISIVPSKKDPKTDTAYHILGFRFRPSWVIDPSSDLYYRWLFIISLAILYNSIIILPRVIWYEFEENFEFLVAWFVLDYGSDLVYILDIIVHLLTGYLKQGLLVREPRKLVRRYLRSGGSRLDILSILPTDFIYFATGYGTPYVALRMNRLLRFSRLLEFVYRTEARTTFPNVFRLVNLIMGVLILIHFNACIYYAISEKMGLASDEWVYPGKATSWRLPPARDEKCLLSVEDRLFLNETEVTNNQTACNNKTITNYDDPLFHKYIWSFYWSTVILTTIAEVPGPVHLEQYPFVIIGMLLGVLIFATIVGNVESVISNINAPREEFQNKLDGVKHYMEYRQVGKELQKKIIKWFDYLWSNKQSLDEQSILSALPEKLRAELAMQVHLDTLKRVSIFQDVEPGLLVELVLKLELQVYSPGDYICRKGDIGKEMYIVKRGKLDVVSDDGHVVFVTLAEGSVFGEISILNIVGNKTGNRRTANIRSVGYSDLFCLSKDHIWDALAEYPEAKKKLLDRGRAILMKDNLIDEEVAQKAEKHSQNVEDKVDQLDGELDRTETRLNCILTEYIASQQMIKQRLNQLEKTVHKRHHTPKLEVELDHHGIPHQVANSYN